MDDATLEALIKVRADGLEAFNDLKDKIQDVTRALDANTAARSANSAAVAVNTGAWAANNPMMAAVVAIIITATTVLAPFTAVLVASTAVLVGFTIGLAALITSLAIVVAPVLAISYAFYQLANNTGNLNGIMIAFKSHISDAAYLLGQNATPAVVAIIQLINNWIAPVTNLAGAMGGFFMDRLPTILGVANNAFFLLFDTFWAMGQSFSYFFDNMLRMAPQIQTVLMILAGQTVGAFNILLGVLLQLTQWFVDRWPVMGPIVGQILLAIGGAVVWLAQKFGEFVDYIVKNWPAIVKQAQDYWAAIQDLWRTVQKDLLPTFQDFINYCKTTLIPTLQDIMRHKAQLKLLIEALIGTVLIFLGILALLVLTFFGVVQILLIVIQRLQEFGNWLTTLNGPLVAIASWIHTYLIAPIQSVISWLDILFKKLSVLGQVGNLIASILMIRPDFQPFNGDLGRQPYDPNPAGRGSGQPIPGASPSSPANASRNITINVHGAQDANATARAIARQLTRSFA